MIVAVISFVALAVSILGTFMGPQLIGPMLNPTSSSDGGAAGATADNAPLPQRHPSDIAWGVVFCALQLFIGAWSAIGLVQNDPLAGVLSQALLTLCAWASFCRPVIAARLAILGTPRGSRTHQPRSTWILLGFILVAGLFACFGLEIPSNHDLLWMYPLCALLEYALVTVTLAGLFFLFQRRGAAPAVLIFALLILGIAEYFIVMFKSTPIQPGDLSALSTAAAVAGTGYTYTLSSFCLYSIALAAISMLLYALAATLRPAREQRTKRTVAINLLVGILCLAGVTGHVTLVDYYNTLGIQVYTWRPLESYYRQGFLPAFISSAQTIVPPKPKNYDRAEAEELIDTYAQEFNETEGASEGRTQAVEQFDEEKPAVVGIMNETFSDLSIYQFLHANYQGPQYFKSISDALATGKLYVSAYGGGTCNTEFEFLTGNSMAYLGQGVYPYTIYNLTHTENLAQQFSDAGYTTTAIHPNHGTNWNRENVYRDFGFDEFLTIDDFRDADTLRGMVTDEATYDRILEMLESNDDPQFIFDVTMQNHSGYETGLIPSDKQTDYLIDGIYDAEVNEYLALIEESDRALEQFLNKLSQLDRKVVVVFFGDHQPFFPSTYNDQWFTGEDEAVHAERLWQTSYVIWANYDVAGRDQESTTKDISVNYLGSYLMDLIGAPLTDYQKAALAVQTDLPAINTTGFCDSTGTWYLSDAATTAATDDAGAQAAEAVRAIKARQDLSLMQYLKLFDHGDGIFTKTLQGAANETDPNLDPGTTKIK